MLVIQLDLRNYCTPEELGLFSNFLKGIKSHSTNILRISKKCRCSTIQVHLLLLFNIHFCSMPSLVTLPRKTKEKPVVVIWLLESLHFSFVFLPSISIQLFFIYITALNFCVHVHIVPPSLMRHLSFVCWPRYFVADSVLDEIIFGWPRQKGGVQLREVLASRLHKAMTSVSTLIKRENHWVIIHFLFHYMIITNFSFHKCNSWAIFSMHVKTIRLV